jgi:hypothetical protein
MVFFAVWVRQPYIPDNPLNGATGLISGMIGAEKSAVRAAEPGSGMRAIALTRGGNHFVNRCVVR